MEVSAPTDRARRPRRIGLAILALGACALVIVLVLADRRGGRSSGVGAQPAGELAPAEGIAPAEARRKSDERRVSAVPLAAPVAPLAEESADARDALARFRLVGRCVDDASGAAIADAEVVTPRLLKITAKLNPRHEDARRLVRFEEICRNFASRLSSRRARARAPESDICRVLRELVRGTRASTRAA